MRWYNMSKIAGLITVSLLGVYILFSMEAVELSFFAIPTYRKRASISRSWLVAAPLRFYAKTLFLFVFYVTMSRP